MRIFAEWRFAGSEIWRDMTESRITDSDGTRNLTLASHVFVWNTVIDLGGLIARVRVRIRAEDEPAAGINRRFRTKEIEFIIDNRLASTIFGDDVVPRSDVDTFPVDLAVTGTSLVVASTGAGIVEIIDELGRVRRVVGAGLPGDSGDGGDPGVARLDSVAIGFGGLVFVNVEDRIRVTNPFLVPASVGAHGVPPRTINTLAAFGALSRARAVRVHTSGAILAIDDRSRLLALNPADPGGVAPPDITLAGVLIPPGAVGQICGGGAADTDGLAATATLMTDATTIAVGPDGEIYYGEQSLGRVRVINPNVLPLSLPGGDVDPGTVQTVAGGNDLGLSGDAGPAVLAQLNRQDGLTVTPARQLVIADTFNVRIRLVNLGVADITFVGTTVSPGDIDTIVGGGDGGVGSAARDVRLDAPNAVELGVTDALLIADGNTVIMVNAGAATITAYGRTVLGGRTREIYDARARNGQPLRSPIAMHVEPTSGALFFSDASTVRVLNLGDASDVFGGADVQSGDV